MRIGGKQVARGSKRTARLLRSAILALWIAIVGIVILWQSINYRGVVATLAEWQFDAIGVYYPTLTCLLLIVLLTLPAALLVLKPGARRGSISVETQAWLSSRAFLKALIAVCGGLGAMALAMLVAMMMLPTSQGTVQQITLDRPMVALPREGATTINGAIMYERTSALDTDQMFAGRSSRYAPIVAPGSTDQNLQFFVELPPVDQQTRRGAISMTGILKRGALPGELVQLYRYAGYRVEQPFFVLHSSEASLRRPYLVVVTQLLIAALLLGIIAVIQRRRVSRLRQIAGHGSEELIPA